MERIALVLGAAGFMGLHLCRKLKNEGYRVYALGHVSSSAPDADLWIPGPIDIQKLSSLPHTPHLVFHLAMRGSVKDASKRAEQALQPTLALMDYLRDQAIQPHILYFSSGATYDTRLDRPLAETDLIQPISWYGMLKRANEELLQVFSEHSGCPVSILRYFSVYGPGQTKQVFFDAYQKIRSQRPIESSGTGRETRDWICIDDALDAIDYAIQFRPKLLNIGSGTETQISDALQIFLNELGVRNFRFRGESLEGYPQRLVSQNSKLCSLGWSAKIPLAEGLQ